MSVFGSFLSNWWKIQTVFWQLCIDTYLQTSRALVKIAEKLWDDVKRSLLRQFRVQP